MKSGAGWVAKGRPETDVVIDRLVTENLSNVQRLFSRLRQLGVLALWDLSPAPVQSAGRG